MRVLITGGAGFIGSHLADRLVAEGVTCRVLDNLSTGKRENLPATGMVDFVHGDIRDAETVTAAVKGMNAIVHLAAVASVQASVDDPAGTHATNFDGTLNLIEVARRSGITQFVYASSAAIYGDNAVLPVPETATPRPLTPYAADKLSGEYYLDFYRRKFGMRTNAFRFFNIYGPRQDPSSPYSGVISIFVERLRSGLPVTIFGDGHQTRDFVYVGDLADLLARTVLAPDSGGEVMNVGRGKEQSLLELLSALEQLTGRAIERQYAPARVGDILRSCADVRRLQKNTGQLPMTDLETGLRHLLISCGIPSV